MNTFSNFQTNIPDEVQNNFKERNALRTQSRMKVLKALDESNHKYLLEKEIKLRNQAIQEIITTETTYFHQLEILMQYFLEPILQKKLINHSLLFTLHENVKTLYNISLELIKELTKDGEHISFAFQRLAPFFKLYSVYACDYQQVLTVLETEEKASPNFKSFISSQESRPEVGRKLPSLLITPIQRIPRYKLLLKEVLQYTPARHKEFFSLQTCLAEVERACTHINTLISQHENTKKLLELQARITNPINLVKPGRMLIKHGSLMRVSRSGNCSYKRYFILLSDTFLYCKGSPCTSLTISCALPLNKCTVKSILRGGLFSVSCLNEKILLYSENNDSNEWLEALQTSVKKYTECRQTLKKDSSSRIPLRHNNVNQLTTDNLQKKYNKRKHIQDEEEMKPYSSKILASKENVPVLKKLKKNLTKSAKKDKVLEACMKEMDHEMANINSQNSNSSINLGTPSSDSFNDAESKPNDEINYSVEMSISRSQQQSSTTHVIGEFITNIVTSIKRLFHF
ncbi:rho guanine nucleotide exchange factor 39-like [Prorops nasuta]|uniref:rho guanine nucleotide exchange factor 39-like n=1 Tax=Prorops nasuta TaxID=863751 RepID=UPI0034CD5ED7